MSLIVGLGSPHGDDQLGWVAIDRLRPRLPAGISARQGSRRHRAARASSKGMTRLSSSTRPRRRAGRGRSDHSSGPVAELARRLWD